MRPTVVCCCIRQADGEWSPDIAADGVTALRLLEAASAKGVPYALALLDFQMPEMDGVTLAGKIRANDRYSTMPIVMLTSNGSRRYAQEALAVGMQAYIAKPVRETVLHDVLLRVLRDRPRGIEASGMRRGTVIVNGAASAVDSLSSPANPVLPSNPRLLIAEDNTVNQKVTLHMVKRLGYQADVVANGLEVLEALSRIRYDAVLMDCQMPEMDGFEATAAIRLWKTERGEYHLPIIAMTAAALDGERERCREAGMDDYISKPVKPELLEAALTRWIQR